MKKRWYITREGSVTKHVVTLIGVLCLAAAVLAGADKPSDANWQTFVDATYKVVLRCPAEWTPTPGYDVAPAFGPEHQQLLPLCSTLKEARVTQHSNYAKLRVSTFCNHSERAQRFGQWKCRDRVLVWSGLRQIRRGLPGGAMMRCSW